MEISARAREVVRGGVDLHVHVTPDLIPRRISDLELADKFRELDLGGFALKSHYFPTAERAAVVQASSGTAVIGTLTLNSPMGGMNPLITDLAARSGARIVWFPTFDSANEVAFRASRPPTSHIPVWAQLQASLAAEGVQTPTVPVSDNSGALLPQTLQVIDAIARHNVTLATGHISANEIMSVVDAALERGVSNIIVTHPEFPSQNLGVAQQQELAERGAKLERCLAPALLGHVDMGQMLRNARAVGAEHNILSTDLGQLNNPPVQDGLAIFADYCFAAGFSDEEVHQMCVSNPRALVGLNYRQEAT